MGRLIANSAVLNIDETGWRQSGITRWLWCFATETLCYYLITPSRGSPVVKKVLGALFKGILISDFYGAYNRVAALAKKKCLFHLFTELVKVDQRNDSLAWQIFRNRLSRLLKDAIRLADKKSAMTPEGFERARTRLHARLDDLCESVKIADADAQRIRKRLVRHRGELAVICRQISQ